MILKVKLHSSSRENLAKELEMIARHIRSGQQGGHHWEIQEERQNGSVIGSDGRIVESAKF
jgi:hypothetical protein